MTPNRRSPRLKDVAEAAGVHISTASRALNERTAVLLNPATLAGGPVASRATLLLDNARIGAEASCKRLRFVLEEAVRLVGSGEIDPGVTGVYPLERAAGAHRVFENRAASGMLILAI